MKIRPIIFLMCLTAASGQTEFKIDRDKPDQVLGYVNGKPITQSQFQFILMSIDANVREALKNKPDEFLRYYGFMDKLADQARAQKIDLKEPYRTKLMMVTSQILSEAAMQEHEYADIVTPKEQEDYYARNVERYSSANVKLIYISFSDPVTELKARQRINSIAQRARKGENFVALVKEFSEDEGSKKKDGDFTIRKSDQIPENIKSAAFALKKGQTTEPIKLPNGYYLFQLVQIDVKAYKDVKDEIFQDIKNERKNSWLNSVRQTVDVKAIDPVKAN